MNSPIVDMRGNALPVEPPLHTGMARRPHPYVPRSLPPHHPLTYSAYYPPVATNHPAPVQIPTYTNHPKPSSPALLSQSAPTTIKPQKPTKQRKAPKTPVDPSLLNEQINQMLTSPPSPTSAPSTDRSSWKCRWCHCSGRLTPALRKGPLGAKTLCNACGMWFNRHGYLPKDRYREHAESEIIARSQQYGIPIPVSLEQHDQQPETPTSLSPQLPYGASPVTTSYATSPAPSSYYSDAQFPASYTTQGQGQGITIPHHSLPHHSIYYSASVPVTNGFPPPSPATGFQSYHHYSMTPPSVYRPTTTAGAMPMPIPHHPQQQQQEQEGQQQLSWGGYPGWI